MYSLRCFIFPQLNAAYVVCMMFCGTCCLLHGAAWCHLQSLCPFMYVACCYVEHSHRGNRKEKTGAYSIWEHAPKALAAGDELCISYAYNCDPIPKMARIQKYWAFLRRGFVPFEYLPVCRSWEAWVLAPVWPSTGVLLAINANRKQKTTTFDVNFMRSQVVYRAAHAPAPTHATAPLCSR